MPDPGDEFLVSYDVACRRRWRRVFRLLHGYGEWVQLSVFRCRLDPRRRRRMERELREIVDTAEDRLLIARLDEEELPGEEAPNAESGAPGRALIL